MKTKKARFPRVPIAVVKKIAKIDTPKPTSVEPRTPTVEKIVPERTRVEPYSIHVER